MSQSSFNKERMWIEADSADLDTLSVALSVSYRSCYGEPGGNCRILLGGESDEHRKALGSEDQPGSLTLLMWHVMGVSYSLDTG